VFVDIKKAFPSVDRSMLIDLLHRLGLAGPMVKAIASTFQFNTCRLKIDGHLSERFPVNMGVREGDIESPRYLIWCMERFCETVILIPFQTMFSRVLH
jgi:hypothetical protein